MGEHEERIWVKVINRYLGREKASDIYRELERNKS